MSFRFFPKPIEPPEYVSFLLKGMYPTVDWTKVYFYEGLPWFLPKWTSAIVLPAALHHQSIRIYFSDFRAEDAVGLSTIVHEGMHVLQASDLWKAKGLGFFRGYVVWYLGLYFHTLWQNLGKYPAKEYWKKSYRYHPMEIPAYQQGDDFFEAFLAFHKKTNYKYWAHSTENMQAFLAENLQFVRLNSGITAHTGTFWKVLGATATLIIAVFFPFLQIFRIDKKL